MRITWDVYGVFLKWWVSPTNPWVFPTKNDHFGMFPKIRVFTPKMDGENHGTPYEKMDDLGGKPTIFWKHPVGG